MARNDRKSKIINVFVYILLVLLLDVTIFFIWFSYNKYSNELNISKSLKAELSQMKNIYNEKNGTNTKLKEEIDNLNNIDNNIANAKTELFKLASLLEQKIINQESDKKIAYLTFDDGPYYATHDFLKVLSEYRVKGTFFTIGLNKQKCYDNKSKDCHELYKKVVDQGHTIANHTYSHLIYGGLYKNTNSFIDQIKKQEDFIKEKTGFTTNIMRFPGGSSTAKYYRVFDSTVNKLKEINYGWVDWSASNGDGGDPGTKAQALARFKKEIDEDIEVVLFHDYSKVTLSMLPEAIEHLQNNNYIILPLFYDSVTVNK